MIGAHDAFTYLNAQDAIMNLPYIKKLWRCQQYSIDTLYKKHNTLFFDLRVCKDTKASIFGIIGKLFKKKKKKFVWAGAHGLAEFKQNFSTLEDLFKYMKKNYPKAQYRLILEKCSSEEVSQFKTQLNSWIASDGKKLKKNKYNLSWAGIKKPWTQLYVDSSIYPRVMHDYCCRLFNWDSTKSLSTNLKNFKLSWTIENWAKKNNPILTTNEIADPNTLYIMDYVGKYGVK